MKTYSDLTVLFLHFFRALRKNSLTVYTGILYSSGSDENPVSLIGAGLTGEFQDFVKKQVIG
jgi:hypothetical protein